MIQLVLTILGIIIVVSCVYFFLMSSRVGNFKIIRLELDDIYVNNEKMALAAIEELRKQGKKCEVIKLKKSFSEVMVDGERYYVRPSVYGYFGFPVQTVQLKPMKTVK